MSREGISALERGISRAPHRDTFLLLVAALQLALDEQQEVEAAMRRERWVDAPSNESGDAFAPAEVPTARTLPVPLTPLTGREYEEAAVAALLRQEQVRLLTLTGPAGVGKTRLGIQVAATMQDAFADGAVFVALGPLHEPDEVLPAISQAVGVQESGTQPLEATLIAALKDQTRLVVLDNFEHLLVAGTTLARLLGACPTLKALVTSRSLLHLRGEHEFAVPPLAFPEEPATMPVEAIGRYPAVALFAQRARAVHPDFALTPSVSQAVASICKRLDGLPLAIELAASRIKMLSPAALLERLEQSLTMLSGGAHDLPERQQTMRAAIDWSYHLLTADERAIFQQLSVFRGGWTVTAAEVVCVLARDGASALVATSAPGLVLDVLTALVDQSLVRRLAAPKGAQGEQGADEEPRFRLLMTLREFAEERLEASGQADRVRRRHTDYYLSLAEQTDAMLVGPNQTRWLAMLEAEHDNLRTALRWTQEQDDVERGLRLAAGIWRFWYLHGHFTEGRRWLESFLALAEQRPETSPAVLARACTNAARLAFEQSVYQRTVALGEQAREIYRALGDKQGIAGIQLLLGLVAYDKGDLAGGIPLHEESVALYRELGQTRSLAMALNNYSRVVHDLGEYARSLAMKEESLALFRASGDQQGIAMVLNNMAGTLYEQGEYDRAALLYAEGLARYQELGDQQGIADTLRFQAYLAFYRGDFVDADALANACLPLYRALGDQYGVASTLIHLGAIACASREYGRALMLAEEGLQMARTLDAVPASASALLILGRATREQGDLPRSRALCLESLRRYRSAKRKAHVAEALEQFAETERRDGNAEGAARLLGAAIALREALGAPLAQGDREGFEGTVAALQIQLGAEALDAAMEVGRAAPIDDLIDDLVADVEVPPTHPLGQRVTSAT
jgi:predicted ATPase